MIIGAGKPIDTRLVVRGLGRYAGQSGRKGRVIATGPATVVGDRQREHGLLDHDHRRFRRRKGLMDQLGIQVARGHGRLDGRAASSNGRRAIPDRLQRVIPVISAGWADADLIAWLDVWASPIRLDYELERWRLLRRRRARCRAGAGAEGGDAAGQFGRMDEWRHGRNWAEEGADPGKSWDNGFKVVATLDGQARRGRPVRTRTTCFIWSAPTSFMWPATPRAASIRAC